MFPKRTSPIQGKTKIADDVLIEDCIAEGYSSLVYRARRGNDTVIVKEFYPYEIISHVERGKDGLSLISTKGADTERLTALTRELRDHEVEVAGRINSRDNSNSMFAFSAYTLDRLKTADTVASYMLMETKDGVTLQEYLSQHSEIDPADAFRILHYICEGLRVQFSKGYYNTDLKPENLWLFTERPIRDGTIIIPIDYGGCISYAGTEGKDGSLTEATVCSSAEWEAPEIHYYVSSSVNQDLDRFFSFLSQGTVLFSVGAIAFRLLMGEESFSLLWQDLIHNETSTKARNRMIRNSLEWSFSQKMPWLIDIVYRFLSKALFFDTDPEVSKRGRFKDVDEMDRDIIALIDTVEANGATPEAYSSYLLDVRTRSRVFSSSLISKTGGTVAVPDRFSVKVAGT